APRRAVHRARPVAARSVDAAGARLGGAERNRSRNRARPSRAARTRAARVDARRVGSLLAPPQLGGSCHRGAHGGTTTMPTALVPPGTYALATVLALAVALTLLAQRASGAPALRNWHRWLYPLVVLAWLASLWVVALRLMASASFAEFVARAILVAGLITAILPLLRDLLAGFAIAMEARFRV